MLLLLQSVLGIARKNAKRYQIAGDSTKKAGRPTDRRTDSAKNSVLQKEIA